MGVSFLSKQSIADELDVNIRTVRRAIRQLEDLCLVKSYRLKRVNNDRRETSSAIVIQPLISVLAVCPSKEASYKQKNINNTNSDTDKPVKSNSELIKKGLVIKLPQTLQHALAPFFDADELYNLSGIVFRAKASIDKEIRIEDNEQAYYNSILSVINAFKRGISRNFEGLLYHAIKATTKTIWLRTRLDSYWN